MSGVRIPPSLPVDEAYRNVSFFFYCFYIFKDYIRAVILLLFNLSVIIMDIKNYSKEAEGVKLHLILRYNSWFDDFKAIFFAHSYP